MRSAQRLVLLATLATILLAPQAQAGPVAQQHDGSYQLLGRVFPDPQGACGRAASGGAPACSPLAQGNVPATTFLGYQEFLAGLRFMSEQSGNAEVWQRYMEVWTLDGDLGGNDDNKAGTDEKANFPGNNLGFWEFTPKGEAHSVGLPVSRPDEVAAGDSRVKSDVVIVRVTDENVPDAGKTRYAISQSIHGIERAGIEGGVRAMEDLITAATSDRMDAPILTTEGLGLKIPTFQDVLQKTIIYFTFPNPDGWRRGDVNDTDLLNDPSSEGLGKGPGVFFQRYNGNGVDLNRDFPDIGFSFRPYSGLSEPESRGIAGAFKQIDSEVGPFAAGDDLHGMLGADSFSYTLLVHGASEYDKNQRLRVAAQAINLVQQDALSWSPLIQPNDQPRGECAQTPVVGFVDCYPMYGQSWGTVYDTINYTTTGSIGAWMQSSIGLNADGINNEMAYSHIDKNVVFEPLIEQMHVDGNKGLIYAHLTQLLNPLKHVFPARGRKGYVQNTRLTRAAKDTTAIPPGTRAQDPYDPPPVNSPDGSGVYEFAVEQGNGIYNGGLRVDVTVNNVQGVNPAALLQSLTLECQGCDLHRGEEVEAGETKWVVVAEDYNQSGLYLQAGLTVAANNPQAAKWRARVEGGPPGPIKFHVEFTQGPATSDGATGGDDPPRLAAYDVASSDFWKRLDPFTINGAGFQAVDANALATGDAQVPDRLDTLILSDEALPGHVFAPLADVPLPAPITGAGAGPPVPCAYQDGAPHPPGCTEDVPFEVAYSGAGRMDVTITPTAEDLTLTLYRVEADGSETKIGATSDDGGDAEPESVPVVYPAAGKYIARVNNFDAPSDPSFTYAVTFQAPTNGSTGGPSAYTPEQLARYGDKLEAFVRDGGNLVLTDGALQILPEVVPQMRPSDVILNTVYVGQVAFASKDTSSQEPDAEGNTLGDPLARNVALQGARFNTGLRRQTFEPTPIGFAIQDAGGDDQETSPQWLVRREAFEAAGGRTVATGTMGEGIVPHWTALGEIKLGKGVVRVVGALLPQPSQKYDHQEGLEPFSVTYTGYVLAENLTDWCRPGRNCVDPRIVAANADGSQLGGAGSGAKACFSQRAFRYAAAKGRGKGLKFGFKTNVEEPVRVDLFQTADRYAGKWRVLKERLIGRFTERRSFTWDGRRLTRFKATDGFYFARFEVRSAAGFPDVKRIALRRKNGKWYRQLGYYGRGTCGLLRQAKLRRMVFGGQDDTPMGASYLLARRAPMKIVVSKNGKVVSKYVKKRAKGRKVVFWWVPRKATKKPGIYKVRFTAGKGKGAMRDTLYTRKLPAR